MNSEFNWWLLLVGIVVGAGLAWLVLADLGRSESSGEPLDEETELQLEADWIAARFDERSRPADRDLLTETLELDRLYRTPGLRLAPTRPRQPKRAPAQDEGPPDQGVSARHTADVERDRSEAEPPERDLG
jgi:hypothetical protein